MNPWVVPWMACVLLGGNYKRISTSNNFEFCSSHR